MVPDVQVVLLYRHDPVGVLGFVVRDCPFHVDKIPSGVQTHAARVAQIPKNKGMKGKSQTLAYSIGPRSDCGCPKNPIVQSYSILGILDKNKG